MSGLLVANIINFFYLQNTMFFWEYLNNRVYMRHLAFLGDAIFKTYVVHELMRRGGICCTSLFSRTTTYITNKNLSIVFEKLSFQAAISWTFPKYLSKPPGMKFMGTVIESMLGSTFLHCPERTREVVVSLMECMEKSDFKSADAADCFTIKVGKPKPCVKTCFGKLATNQRVDAKAASKNTLVVQHPSAECRKKAVTEVATPNGQQMPRQQKPAKQQNKSTKTRRSQRLLSVRGGKKKKSNGGSRQV